MQINKYIILLLLTVLPSLLICSDETIALKTIENNSNIILKGKSKALEIIKVKIYNTQYKDDFYYSFIKTDKDGNYILTKKDINLLRFNEGTIAFEFSTNDAENSKKIIYINRILDTKLQLKIFLKSALDKNSDNIMNKEESKNYMIEGRTENNLRALKIIISDLNNSAIMFTENDIVLDENGMFTINNIDLRALEDGELTVVSKGYDIAGNKARTFYRMHKDTIVTKPILLKNIKNNNLTNIINKKILVASGEAEAFSQIDIEFKQNLKMITESVIADKNGLWELVGGDLNLNIFENGNINVTIYQTDVAKNRSKGLRYINEKFKIPIFPLFPIAISPSKYQLLYTINGHEDEIRDIFITNSDLYIATYGYLKVWGKSYAKFKREIEVGDKWVNSVVVSDGKVFIALSDGNINVYSEKELKLLKKIKVDTLAVLNLKIYNEQLITSSASGTIKIWDIKTLDKIYENKNHQWDIKAIAIDKNYLYSGSDDYSIKKIDLNTNKLVNTLKAAHTGAINDIIIYKKLLISASDDKTIIIRDINTRKIKKILKGHKKSVNKLYIANDFLISVSSDRSMIFWDLNSGEKYKKIRAHTKKIEALYVNDFNIVTGSRDQKVKIWGYDESLASLESENETKKEKYELLKSINLKKGYPTSLSQNENNIIISSDSGNIYFYNKATHNYVKKYSTLDKIHKPLVRKKSLSLDDNDLDDESIELPLKIQKIHVINNFGNKLLAGLEDSSIKIWDMEKNKAIGLFTDADSSVTDIAISSINILTGTKKGGIGVYDIETNSFINLIEGHQYNVNSVALHEDIKVISAGDDYSIKVRDIESGDMLLDIKNAHENIITKLVVYKDFIISASLDGTIKVRNIIDGKLIKILDLHKAGVTSLALDDDNLISASNDNTLIVWDLKDFSKITTMNKHTKAVKDVMIADDYIISIADDKTIKVWKYYE